MKFGENYWVAVISLLLYFSLFLTAWFHFSSLRERQRRNQGKFTDYKVIFLMILMVSAIFSLPLWGICVILGGPDDCQWESRSYAFCWSLHLMALVGYSCAIGIPTIMWSDIINGSDHQSFLKSFAVPNLDTTRIWFLTCVCCYAILEIVTIISMAIFMSPYHMNDYFNENKIYHLSILLEPFVICLFAGGCLVIGIQLQLYVRSVRFDRLIQISLCYMTRSLFVFNLRTKYIPVSIPYVAWIACTHWAPQVICSFCLLIIMCRSKGGDSHQSTKYQTLTGTDELSSPNGSGSAVSSSSPLLSHYHSDEDEAERHSNHSNHSFPDDESDFLDSHEYSRPRSRSRSNSQNHSRTHSRSFNIQELYYENQDNESVLSDEIIHQSTGQESYEFSPLYDSIALGQF